MCNRDHSACGLAVTKPALRGVEVDRGRFTRECGESTDFDGITKRRSGAVQMEEEASASRVVLTHRDYIALRRTVGSREGA